MGGEGEEEINLFPTYPRWPVPHVTAMSTCYSVCSARGKLCSLVHVNIYARTEEVSKGPASSEGQY